MLTFGTDGVRGVAGVELTVEAVVALGRAAARVLGDGPYVVGRDTRVSGPMLVAALSAGLMAEGAAVVDVGCVPTPAVAHQCAVWDAPGAMVSASHNPFADNGVKLFARGGRKLPDEVERAIEAEMARLPSVTPATGAAIGAGQTAPAAPFHEYPEHLAAARKAGSLDRVHVVLDCANGATGAIAEGVFADARRVTVIGNTPNGTNINDGCGSTHPELLQRTVVDEGADLGLAFDGDGDRVIAVDHTGGIVDGDAVIALHALDMRERGLLRHDTVVVTVMTNLGFRLAMAEHGIDVVETKVGDRYVLEALDEGGFSLGGEQSGHVIFRDLATTGDGLLTGLLLADLVQRQGRPLAELAAAAMTRLPQVLLNVRVEDRGGLDGANAVWDEVRRIEDELAGTGRVLLRPSGTEPVIRVMVEAPTHELAEATAEQLAGTVVAALGAAKGP